MRKLTAGIFAGILTIVTVNAADAAIASKAYVDQKHDESTTAITNLSTTVGEHTTSITSLETTVGDSNGGLVKDVAGLKADINSITGGNGSIASQIADALGDIPEGSNVATELGKKQDKSTAAYSLGTANGGWQALTTDELGALQSGITSDDVAQITTNKNDISGINTKIGTVPDGKNVIGLIDEAKTAATDGVDSKLGDLGEGNDTVADALAEKQDMLNGTNVTMTGTGNAIVGISAENGVVTATKGAVIPEVTTTGQTGTYVLTATVTESGVTNYMWESIERATAQTTEP